MPRYDYSRVPQHLLATYARARLADAPAVTLLTAYDAVQAAALVPERTRAELAELVLTALIRNLNAEMAGSFVLLDATYAEIRALVNEARTAPITPR